MLFYYMFLNLQLGCIDKTLNEFRNFPLLILLMTLDILCRILVDDVIILITEDDVIFKDPLINP